MAGLLNTDSQAQDLEKKLPLEGETILLDGSVAFIIPVEEQPQSAVGQAQRIAKPWVWYAPTLPNLPGSEERWMFERFVKAGVAIAGIDAGESYGSPTGNRVFDRLYAEMIRRGYSEKPILLGRSRGGLQTLSWAAEHPDQVGGWAGIYPVCNLESYPGLDRAAGAYELTAQQLKDRLIEFNPIDRMSKLAAARVPLFAIHGDVDKVVPLEVNSGLLKEVYNSANGPEMELIVPSGQGHNMWEGFFRCNELVNFVINHAKADK
jgi:pimeloyl-ACP methyl ester carboxylesterase